MEVDVDNEDRPSHIDEQHEQQERERRVLIVESRENITQDAPSNPAAAHQYEDLQQMVNATYRGILHTCFPVLINYVCLH